MRRSKQVDAYRAAASRPIEDATAFGIAGDSTMSWAITGWRRLRHYHDIIRVNMNDLPYDLMLMRDIPSRAVGGVL
jgi:hypothetical protein